MTPVLVQAYMPTVQCIITAYNEAIGEKVGRSADEVIAELGSDYITNLSRERAALRAENEALVADAEMLTGVKEYRKRAYDAENRAKAAEAENERLTKQVTMERDRADAAEANIAASFDPEAPVATGSRTYHAALHPQEGNDE